ncbi:MAG: hypothetical protein JKY59_05565 [Emcibacter sp.]|nr:hypothetical protein [Emcibacter sp.]
MRPYFFLILCVCSLVSTTGYSAEQKPSVSAEVFGQRENILKLKLSPNGNRVASLRNYQGKISLVTQSLEPAEKGQVYVTPFEEGEFKSFHWVSNDRLVVSLSFPA